MNSANRIDFLDTLKAFIIVLVVATHTSLAYAVPHNPNWAYNSAGSSQWWIVTFILESGVMMPIMFFISGYFTLPSLTKRSPGDFLKGKLVRIGLPFALGLVFIMPTLGALSYYSDGGTLPLGHVLAQYSIFRFNNNYHFWYLGVLLLFFVIVAAIYAARRSAISAIRIAPSQPSPLFFPGVIALTTLLCFAINLVTEYGQWTSLYVLQFQTVKAPMYAMYFLLGIYAYRSNWFAAGYRPRLFPWALIYAASLLAYLGVVGATGGDPVTLRQRLLINLFASVEVPAALLALAALFQALQHRAGPFVRRFASLSYSAYVAHLSVVFLVVYLTRNIVMPLTLKYVLQVIFIVIAAWTVASLWSQLQARTRAWPKPARLPTAGGPIV
jgi:glucan biosynthesis protein C